MADPAVVLQFFQERGFEKERQFATQIFHKQLEEERARIPKANPYPYTTDYPVVENILSDELQQVVYSILFFFSFIYFSFLYVQIPSKPEPKQCTKPEAFQLESLVRHEEEMQRKLAEKEQMQKEEAQRRIFKAQRIMRE